MKSGGTPTTSVREYWKPEILWISPKDFGNDLYIDDSELSISKEGADAARLQVLDPGTLAMVVRSGVLAHTLPVSVLQVEATINQDVKGIVLSDRVIPDYVAGFLKVFEASVLPYIRKMGATVQSVNTAELLTLPIPVPPLAVQRLLIAELVSDQSKRDTAISQAQAKISSLNEFVLKELGVEISRAKRSSVFAARRATVGHRLDPFFHWPAFLDAEQQIAGQSHAMLCEIVEFSNRVWDAKSHPKASFDYIEISGVDRVTGRAVPNRISVENAPSRARMVTRPGDIIVSLTRPHHGSIALLDDQHEGCIASTGFAVICDVDTDRTSARFVWTMLRLSICLDQMLRRSSGGNYPAITQEELGKVLIPLPDKATQQRICDEVERRHAEARRLEAEAQSIWQAARQRFEDQLLNGVVP